MSTEKDADKALQEVAQTLRDIPSFQQIVVTELRRALDEVIDGPRTGRYSVDQLEKTEKTYIGTKVEILLRHALKLSRGKKLDNLIAESEVDTKFSISSQWMIPREAIGQICLLVGVDEHKSICRVGLLRATEAVLCPGKNQDSKRHISAQGKGKILWLLDDTPIPENMLLHLSDATRHAILSPRSGKKRVEALFTHVTGRLISRSQLRQVIQLQGDPLKRAREAKANLKSKGFLVLCSAYLEERKQMQDAGFKDVSDDDWLSLPVGPKK